MAGQHTYKQKVRLAPPAWGVGVRTLLVRSDTWGNALCTHLLAQASVGLAPSRQDLSVLSVSPRGASRGPTH